MVPVNTVAELATKAAQAKQAADQAVVVLQNAETAFNNASAHADQIHAAIELKGVQAKVSAAADALKDANTKLDESKAARDVANQAAVAAAVDNVAAQNALEAANQDKLAADNDAADVDKQVEAGAANEADFEAAVVKAEAAATAQQDAVATAAQKQQSLQDAEVSANAATIVVTKNEETVASLKQLHDQEVIALAAVEQTAVSLGLVVNDITAMPVEDIENDHKNAIQADKDAEVAVAQAKQDADAAKVAYEQAESASQQAQATQAANANDAANQKAEQDKKNIEALRARRRATATAAPALVPTPAPAAPAAPAPAAPAPAAPVVDINVAVAKRIEDVLATAKAQEALITIVTSELNAEQKQALVAAEPQKMQQAVDACKAKIFAEAVKLSDADKQKILASTDDQLIAQFVAEYEEVKAEAKAKAEAIVNTPAKDLFSGATKPVTFSPAAQPQQPAAATTAAPVVSANVSAKSLFKKKG